MVCKMKSNIPVEAICNICLPSHIQASVIIFSIPIMAVGLDLIPMMLPLCDGVLCPLILRLDQSQWHLPVAVHQTAVSLDGEELQVSKTQELLKSI